MKLTLEGLKNTQDWEAAGIALPSYDIEKVAENTKKLLHGFTSEPETSSVSLSADWLTPYWKKGKLTKVLPV